MTPLIKYKYVKYDTGDGYIREGLEPHPEGEWMKAADVEAREREIKDTLQHMLEYWNGDPNDRAMQDAIEHLEAEAQRLLAQVEEQP
jgi:hypothetical protein